MEYFHKKTKYIAFSTVSCAVLNIILNYYLLTHYSYKSAAIATVVSYFLYFLFHMYMARRICGHWLFDVRRMGIGILIFFVLMAITLTNIPNIIVRILVFLCVTGYTYYYFRDFIDSKVRAYITAWKK